MLMVWAPGPGGLGFNGVLILSVVTLGNHLTSGPNSLLPFKDSIKARF